MNHIRAISESFTFDPVFHAKMYVEVATKYMLHGLKPLIVTAFRYGVRLYLGNTRGMESLIAAARIIMGPLLTPVITSKDVKERDWSMADALVQIIADNWGWIGHEESMQKFLDEKRFKPLQSTVGKRVGFIRKHWRQGLGIEEDERTATDV
jgi:hypothetical protein